MTKKLISLLYSLIFLATALYGTPSEESIVVQLVDRAAVTAPHVNLGQIASIECNDSPLRDQLIHLEITAPPSVGRSKLVSAYRVTSLIKELGLKNVEVLGHQTVVTLKTRLVTDSEIKKAIRDWLSAQNDGIHEMTLDFVRLPSQWEIPAGDSVTLSAETRKSKAVGPTNLSLLALIGDKTLATARARVEIQWHREAAVVIRPLARNQAITEEHIEVRKADVTSAKGLEMAEPSDLIGMVASRNLGTGSLITVHDIEKPVLVTRGSMNRIIVDNGDVRMGVTGAEALQNGKKGDFVLFRNPVNPKENLRAAVVGPGVALIEINTNQVR